MLESSGAVKTGPFPGAGTTPDQVLKNKNTGGGGELPGQPGFIVQLLETFGCSFFVLKSSTLGRRKCTPSQPAPSCPAMLGHGADVYFCALSSLSLCLFFSNLPQRVPTCISYSDFKSFWNPGMKAIAFINHFPQFLCVHSVRPLNAG